MEDELQRNNNNKSSRTLPFYSFPKNLLSDGDHTMLVIEVIIYDTLTCFGASLPLKICPLQMLSFEPQGTSQQCCQPIGTLLRQEESRTNH